MKYQFIEQHKQEFPIVVMCGVLDVRGKWLLCLAKTSCVSTPTRRCHLTEEIRQEFSAHQGRYGSPRVHAELHDRGRSVACKRIAKLMREAGLYAKRTRKRALTTRRDPSHAVAPNLFNRECTASVPNEKWVTDSTYIPTMQGWLYLAVILDLYSRMVVGWSMSGNGDEKLVERALDQALARRCPKAGLVHHRDRGSQYTSQAYQACLERAGIQPSMSRKGTWRDNAAMELFFGAVKDECVGSTIYSSPDKARLDLFTSMEMYYNRIRRHSTLGYVSPFSYEQMVKQQM